MDLNKIKASFKKHIDEIFKIVILIFGIFTFIYLLSKINDKKHN